MFLPVIPESWEPAAIEQVLLKMLVGLSPKGILNQTTIGLVMGEV